MKEELNMKRLKVLALAVSVLGISACATGYDRPYADRATYAAPRASLDPAMMAQPGAGAQGGAGAGPVTRY